MNVVAVASRIFISHAGKDQAWAEWARWHLENAGYVTVLDCVDWVAGTNFVEAMHKALARQNPMLVLLSAAYLEPTRYTTDEWTARLAQRRRDPDAKLIPLRVDKVDLHGGIWAPISVPDVFGLPPSDAVTVLVDAVRRVVEGPGTGAGQAGPPAYPGASVAVAGVDVGPRPPGSLPLVWNLARRNPAFTGRDGMLKRLHDTLSGGQRAAVQALHGMGGVGKTQLALEYGHRFAGEYDLSWWVPAEQPRLIGDHLAALAVMAGVAAADTATPAAVDALLSHLRGRSRWLLVFDNAEDRDDLVPWLPDGPGHLIITSRNPGWTGVAQSVDVDVFSREESVTLLRTHLPHLTDTDADRLADALGDLPLAIGQAADLLGETRLSVDAYLAELGAHAAELLGGGRPPVGYPVPLAATVTLSAERLARDDPAAGQLLALCAHMGPEPIPFDLFTAGPGLLPQALAEVARRPVAFGRTAARLASYGLARITNAGILMHRLTLAILRDLTTASDLNRGTIGESSSGRNADPKWASVALRLLEQATPGSAWNDPASWATWQTFLPHIIAVTSSDFRNDPTQLEDGSETLATLASLLMLTADYLLSRGSAAEAADMMRRGYEIDRRLLGDEDPVTLRSAIKLAFALSRAGKHDESLRLNRATLKRLRQVRGNDHRDTIGAASNIAADLMMLGRYQEALDLQMETLANRRRVLGLDDPETAISAKLAGLCLINLQRFEEALDILADTLEREKRVLGTDHPEVLHTASYLSSALRGLGRYEQALRLDEDVLHRRRRVLGEDHPLTTVSAKDLAADRQALERQRRNLAQND